MDAYRSRHPLSQTIGSRGGDGNCHLHIGITIKTSHATRAAASAMAIDKGLAAAGDDIHTLYIHSIIKVSQVQLLGVKCT